MAEKIGKVTSIQLTLKLKQAVFVPALANELLNNGVYAPTEADRKGALQGVLRVQRVYNISTEDMASGHVYGQKTNPLTAQDMYDLGQQN